MAVIHITAPSRYKVASGDIRVQAEKLSKKFGFLDTEQINIAFVGRRKMRGVANTYKHEDVALPVLSFPYASETPIESDELPLAAEIVICYPQAVLLAAERNKKVLDMIIWLIDHAMETVKK